MIRPGSAPGVSGWISHSASCRLLSSTIFTRGKRRSMNVGSTSSTSSPVVSISASTTASSAHIAAPCAISGGHACAASPMMIVRPRYQGDSTQIASIHW